MKPALSIQLHSLRTLPGLPEVLNAAKLAGYRCVELVGSHLDLAGDVRRQLDAHELSASSSHVGMAALRERFDAVMAACKTLGFAQLFMPAVPPDERHRGEPYWTALGQELGLMATRAKDRGIELGYHNHDWELKSQPDGRSALECLFAGAADTPLAWQADIAWLVRGGGDPVALMQRHQARLISVHAKDLAPAGTKLDDDGWADVGQGVLDWRGRLAPAAIANGARCLVAEHDKPNDPVRFGRNSFSFLNSL